jgi:phosphatidylglycerophosphate synthase
VSYPGLLVFDESGGPGVRSRVGGLSLLDRGVRTMVRAGVERLLIIVPEGSSTELTAWTRKLDVELEFVTWGQAPKRPLSMEVSKPTLVVLGDYVHHHSSLTGLVNQGLYGHDIVVQTSASEPGDDTGVRTAHESSQAASLSTDGTKTTLQFATPGAGAPISGAFLISGQAIDGLSTSGNDLLGFLSAISAELSIDLRATPDPLWRRVSDRRSARAAKSMLFSQVTKATSGPVSRHLNARLSIPTSKVLVETGLSPHMVTVLFVLTTGLTAVYLLSTPLDYARLALAGFLWHMAAVFDRCDGEIARVKLCESKFGAWFDTVTDNIAYFAFLIALIVGMLRLHPGDDLYLYLSLSALGSMTLSLGLMYRYAMQTGSGSLQRYFYAMKDMPDRDKTAFQRITERFGFMLKRDFFAFAHFVLCLLDAFQVMYWLTIIGIFGHAAGVILSKRRLTAPTRQVEVAVGASADALAARRAENAR